MDLSTRLFIVLAAISPLSYYSADPWDYEKMSPGETRRGAAPTQSEIRIPYLLSRRSFSMK